MTDDAWDDCIGRWLLALVVITVLAAYRTLAN